MGLTFRFSISKKCHCYISPEKWQQLFSIVIVYVAVLRPLSVWLTLSLSLCVGFFSCLVWVSHCIQCFCLVFRRIATELVPWADHSLNALSSVKSFHTCLICKHGDMWEYEEFTGQLCSTQGWIWSDAAWALRGPVGPSTSCVFCSSAKPYSAPVPEHNNGHPCRLYGSSGPVLSPHSPA